MSEHKYPVMAELARVFKTGRGQQPTGAGAKRDAKLKAAEDAAMGLGGGATARKQAREQDIDSKMRAAAKKHKARKIN